MNLEIVSQSFAFGGDVLKYQHQSSYTKTPMNLSIFLPSGRPQIVLLWLSGLTCTEDNFMTKAGAQSFASDNGIVLICPDTSPRGTDLPGEHDSWDLGSGAGFYVDATEEPWKKHYQMYSYITTEIPELIKELHLDHVPLSISGHSMGGHGALVLGLKNPQLFKSISAFAPIVNPSAVPWGQKAFKAYLGSDQATWQDYDASLLVEKSEYRGPILIDQGTKDDFLETQLQPHELEKNCPNGISVELRHQENYDHSYYFISSFIEDHLKFHLESMNR